MQDKIFYTACFGFIWGILLRSIFVFNIYFVLFLGLLSLVILFSRSKPAIIFSIFALTIVIGILRFHLSDKNTLVPSEEAVNTTAMIVSDPDIRETNQKLTVETDSTQILITTGLDTKYKYGDKLEIVGNLKLPENFKTLQGKEFDYVNYLKKDDIEYVMSYPDMEIISRGNGNWLKSGLFSLKHKLLDSINNSIYYPENLLMNGLILGERSPFSEELRESFVRTGTIHIVALSGYNVTIVAEWFMKIFAFLPFIWSIGMGIFSIFLFVLMTGFSSTAVRAGVMATLGLFARGIGREYDVARALMLALVFMLLFNPYLLVYDVSFELSFIATIAIIFLAPKMEKYFQWVTKSFGLREIITLTSAAYIFVLPFILYKMGNLSLIALPANMLVLPFIPLTMGLGFLTSVLGALWFPLGIPFGLISDVFLKYELWAIESLGHLSFASINIPNFPIWITLFIYAWFTYKLFRREIKKFVTFGDR